MRHFKGVFPAPIALVATALLAAALIGREADRSFPIPPQISSTINSSAQLDEQTYAYCPPVNCSGGGSR